MRNSDLDTGSAGQASQEEATVAELLRAVGKREVPPEDYAEALKTALHAEWRATVDQQVRLRRRRAFAGAAVAAVVVMGIAANLWIAGPTEAAVARVVQVAGTADAIAARAEVKAGERLVTQAGGRMAVAFNSGITVRLDQQTEIHVERGDRLQLLRGAIYIDSGREGTAAPLVVSTTYGNVRHLGTQYEVRMRAAELSVSVREGKIGVDRKDASLQGMAGEQLVVSSAGNVRRETIAPDAAEWSWIAAVTPPYEIDQRPLTEFLLWAGRELGRDVVFATPAAQAQAGQVILRGSVAGLTPDQAVDAVLVSTPLRAERVAGRLVIRE
jgi:ferric-dicitrate binding protein FerR (iron transport regulator)